MWLALLMALLVVAGTSWFFRDQLKAAWLTYTMKADDANVDTNVPSAAPPTPEAGGKSATFDPSAPALPKAIPVAQPKAPEPAPPSPPPGATTSATPPPVTVLPALPASGNVASGPGTGSLVEVPGTAVAGPPVNVVPAPPPAPPLIVGATAETKPALEALQKFFLSRKWQDRLPFVQAPASMTPLMEQYYAANPDGPLHPSHIQLIRFDKEPETGPPHCVFQVAGGGLKQPLPIMVEHADDGWKVDWLTFTEFKDELLLRFLESPQPEPARFHVLMRRAHYFDDDVPALDKKTCFQVMPPMPGFTGDVFAIKGSPVARDLDKHLGWDVSQAAVVVELQWRQDEKSKWVELTNLVQLNWRNVEPPAPKAVPVDSEEPAPKAAS